MSNDDSLNDSDELFSLYSSKKITDTFKAQLKKIAASYHHLTDSLPQNKSNEVETLTVQNSETSSVCPEVNKPSEILQIDVPESPIEVCDNDASNDSIEVVSELPVSRGTRQSERLRKKRGLSISELNNSWSSSPGNQRKTRNKKGRTGRKTQKGKTIEEITLENSPLPTETEDELNPLISVKVIWKSVNVKKFQVRKFQKLSYIFELLSEEENIPEDKIILTFNNIRVTRNDTPDSLNLQVYHFLDGGVLTELTNNSQTPNSHIENDIDSVMIKFQDVNKKIIKLNLNKHEKLKLAMIKCSEQLEIPLERIKFFFDGEALSPFETSESLGLENDEVIDIKIYN